MIMIEPPGEYISSRQAGRSLSLLCRLTHVIVDSHMKPTGRRGFLKTVAAAGALPPGGAAHAQTSARAPIDYPRKYSGRHLAMLAFPLGGVGAGSISLGGRGQFRDWEIFNKTAKGKYTAYDFG